MVPTTQAQMLVMVGLMAEAALAVLEMVLVELRV